MTLRQASLLAGLAAAVLAAAPVQAQAPSLEPPSVPSYEFRNGRWFDGNGFEERTVYAVDGRFTMQRPPQVNETVDLHGAYVVPPFGEAHNHNLVNSERQVDEFQRRYLEAGVFYAKMLSNLPRLSAPLLYRFNQPSSMDVVFANAPLTASGGHPVLLRERLLERGIYTGFTKETLPGQGYVIIDDEEQLELEWPAILSYRPDLIKVMLVHSEEFERRRDDPEYYGSRGVDPELLPSIVERAHRHRLRVSAHVESAEDFGAAVRAGVDEIAHLPGFSRPVRIAEEDAALAAERGVVVVTTTVLARRLQQRPGAYEAVRDAQIENLRLLLRHGVPIAIGSDEPMDTSLGEALYLYELGIFDNFTLLKMWTETTPRSIFPGRRIGAFDEGYEASFLALEADPLDDFENVQRIRLRFKQGQPLEVPQPAEPTAPRVPAS